MPIHRSDSTTLLISRENITDDARIDNKQAKTKTPNITRHIVEVHASSEGLPGPSRRASSPFPVRLNAPCTRRGYQRLPTVDEHPDIQLDTIAVSRDHSLISIPSEIQHAQHDPRRVSGKAWVAIAATVAFITAGNIIYHVAPLLGEQDIDPIV